MAPAWIVEVLDVAEYVRSGVVVGAVDFAGRPFGLQGREESLNRGIVLDIAGPAHQQVMPLSALSGRSSAQRCRSAASPERTLRLAAAILSSCAPLLVVDGGTWCFIALRQHNQ